MLITNFHDSCARVNGSSPCFVPDDELPQETSGSEPLVLVHALKDSVV